MEGRIWLILFHNGSSIPSLILYYVLQVREEDHRSYTPRRPYHLRHRTLRSLVWGLHCRLRTRPGSGLSQCPTFSQDARSVSTGKYRFIITPVSQSALFKIQLKQIGIVLIWKKNLKSWKCVQYYLKSMFSFSCIDIM